MKLSNRNYYSQKANLEYLSASQYKDFAGSLGSQGCEARAMARLNGEWQQEPSTAMLVGSFVDSYFEGTINDFQKEHPEIFTRTGELKCEYKKAKEIIIKAENDPIFSRYMSGEKQVIMTAKLFGVKWKIKMDSYHEGKCIVDLKVVKNIRERMFVPDMGYTNFIEYWGYDLQLALYQAVVEANTGKKLPCFIAAIDKTQNIDLEVISIPQSFLDHSLNEVEYNLKRIKDLKKGNVEPVRCEKCDYCIHTKKLMKPIGLFELIER